MCLQLEKITASPRANVDYVGLNFFGFFFNLQSEGGGGRIFLGKRYSISRKSEDRV